MDVGNQIRERRQALGLSQEELAQRLYVSRVTVSHWETGRTLPDVQSMLLIANLFGTTIDELVRGDVDEMREMVEKNERRTKTFAVALAAVEVVVVTSLAVTAVAGRDYLEPVLRLLLAVLVLAFSLVTLVARRVEGGDEAKSAAELLGAATGDPVEAARASGAALGMRLVLQILAGLAVGIGTSMFGFGVAKFLVGYWEEKRPEALRANEIEAKDERNRMIRERAGAVSGSVLQWTVLAVAWVAILLEAPVWVPIACAAVFVGKVILEFCLAAYFNRRM